MEISRIKTWSNMISCVKNFQIPLKLLCQKMSRIRGNKNAPYDLLHIQVIVFFNCLRKKRDESFVFHADWKYSCLPVTFNFRNFCLCNLSKIRGKVLWSFHYNLNFITRSTHLEEKHQRKLFMYFAAPNPFMKPITFSKYI